MTQPTTKPMSLSAFSRAAVLALIAVLSACSDGVSNESTTPPAFEIRSSAPSMVLIEGDQQGLTIPLTLERSNGHTDPVTLEIRGQSEADVEFVTSSFSRLELTPSEDESNAILKLAISDLPIQPQQREFIIVATDGIDTASMPISVTVRPTSAPDVYLLAGQSNMVGFSSATVNGIELDTREEFVGGLDEPDPRILQLNGSRNNEFTVFIDPESFVSEEINAEDPVLVQALDPLHVPVSEFSDIGKDDEYIGLGLTFAKRALVNTTANIVLVPAAWSGSAFCATELPPAHWMPSPTDNENLGNTLMFDRAVTRANLALRESGGVLRGILWHQGESDANSICAPHYADNMVQLVEQMRARIDTVGSDSLNRISDTTIPFVVGTMSRGADDRADLSEFSPSKQIIDDAHFNFPNTVTGGALSDHSDLTPGNGYPCGNQDCIHFGPEALREMGSRYYAALLRAL